MDLAAIAAELYALAPGAFTAARNDRAKQVRAQGQVPLAKEVARLPKPSVAAGAVNALALRRPEALHRVAALGVQLREAQEDLDPARLRALAQERPRLLAEAVAEARAAAAELGSAVSDAAAVEIEQTLRAATADADASRAVQSGLLVRTLEGNGLEPVDLTGALAVPGVLTHHPAPGQKQERRRPEEQQHAEEGRRRAEEQQHAEEGRRRAEEQQRAEQERREDRAEAEADLGDAQQALEEAQAELNDAEEQASEAAGRARSLTEELADLRRRITDVEGELEAAEREAGTAERARRLAARLVDREERAVARARDRLEGLS